MLLKLCGRSLLAQKRVRERLGFPSCLIKVRIILIVQLAQLKFAYHLCILMTTCVIRKECENIFVLGDEKLWW